KDFGHYAKIDSKGSEGSNYNYIDLLPNPGINYYKLVQTDKDGTSKELGVQVVNVNLSDSKDWIVFPNPVNTESFSISRLNTNDKLKSVKIYDLKGKIVFQKNLQIFNN